MVSIDIDGDEVLLTVLGSHKLWSLTSEIRFPKNAVRSATKTGRGLRPPWLLRVGTAFPGLICAGALYGWRRKEFWDRTRHGHGICIELANAAYTRIVVDVADPDAIIRKLQQV